MQNSKQLAILGLILSALLLGACGQKGPLFIPEEDKPMATDAQVDANTDAEEVVDSAEVEVLDMDPAQKPEEDSEKKPKTVD